MNNFNFMGFLIAHNRMKDKTEKSTRTRTAMLSAMVPANNFAGMLTPLALADKEVVKVEKDEVNAQLSTTNKVLNDSQNFIVYVGEGDGTLDAASKAAFYVAYLLSIDPTITGATVTQNAFFQRITDPAVQQAIITQLGGALRPAQARIVGGVNSAFVLTKAKATVPKTTQKAAAAKKPATK